MAPLNGYLENNIKNIFSYFS
jgi:hypothetical protein